MENKTYTMTQLMSYCTKADTRVVSRQKDLVTLENGRKLKVNFNV